MPTKTRKTKPAAKKKSPAKKTAAKKSPAKKTAVKKAAAKKTARAPKKTAAKKRAARRAPAKAKRFVFAASGPIAVTPGASSSHASRGAADAVLGIPFSEVSEMPVEMFTASRIAAPAPPAPFAPPGTSGLPKTLPPSQGALSTPDRAAFDVLAQRDDVPGAAGVLEVKFLMTGVDTRRPVMWLINTKTYSYHYDFATQALGMQIGLGDFNAQTYFTDRRKNLAGQILAHDRYVAKDGTAGAYAVEFWPTDPVKAPFVAKAYKAIKKAMPFAAKLLRYHPAGETHEALFELEKAQFRRLGVKSITTAELFENVTFSPLNLGTGFGVLRIFGDGGDTRPPSIRDVVLFRSVPNDLGHVAGIITDAPQTPLSHINLKAKQDKTPNAYIKDASTDPRVMPLVGKLVEYVVTAEGFTMREATAEEAEKYLDSIRPPEPQIPGRDLTRKDISPLDWLSHRDVVAFGAKTANVADLRRILDPGVAPDGFGIPFSFYDAFMQDNGLYDAARAMIGQPSFHTDVTAREEALKKLRKRIKDGSLSAELAAQVATLQKSFPPGQGIRCRSSTNNEDLVGFSGAGLYDSYTHRPDEGDLGKTLKQVWASLWNFRAFDEREFFRVDHFGAAMGVLCHNNTDDERANGVAITRNIYDPNWPGFYVNAQLGENLVTNPEGGAVPDELLISAIGPNGEYETQYIRHSSEVKPGEAVLDKPSLAALVKAMETIQAHFKRVYERDDDPTFAMDIEFKIDKDGKLFVKQARPVV